MKLDSYAIDSWDHEAAAQLALSGLPLDDNWVKDECDKLSRTLLDVGTITGARALPPLKDLSAGAFAVLGGSVSPSLQDLLRTCIEVRFELPSTRPKFAGGDEPCGPIATAHNLSPEWIRHFLGTLYDKSEFTKALKGREFFPFENRDHLVHSLTCSLLGPVCLGLPPGPELIAAISEKAPPSLPPSNVFDALTHFYKTEHRDWFSAAGADTIPEAWLKKAWIATSIWHDSGYDSATWYLLTSREFMHCHAVFDVEDQVRFSLHRTLGIVASTLTGMLSQPISDALERARGHLEFGRPLYHILWGLEGCENQDPASRCWGRLHAILSAYEFLMSRPKRERTRLDVQHLAAAIAEHHEQVHLRPTAEDMSQLRTEFRRNPMAALLAFADSLAGFHRVKIEAPSEFVVADLAIGLGRITFDMDVNTAPLWVQQAAPGSLKFFRGRRHEPRNPDRYSVFGMIEKAGKSKAKKPSLLKTDRCPFGGCRGAPRP